ncbi:MAG: PKD domain-containing protein [bacterium]|nr:PKD domain-containing protein [bacterium]
MKKIVFFTVTGILLLCAVLFTFTGCEKQTFLAEEGDTLILSAEKSNVALNETIWVLIRGYRTDGSLMWDGTRIDLSVENGILDQSSVEIIDGQARVFVTANTGSTAGTSAVKTSTDLDKMTVYANSGNVEQVSIEINIAAEPEVEHVTLSLNPTILPYDGGRTNIMVRAFDVDMQPLANIFVRLETSAGVLDSRGSAIKTDTTGTVSDYLETTQAATITAYAGTKNHTADITLEDQDVGQITININPAILPYSGGTSQIQVRVFDSYTNPIPGVSVALEATSGTLASQGAPLTTNANGTILDSLYTTTSSSITVYAGSQSRSVEVTLDDEPEPETNEAPVAEFSYSPTEPLSNEVIFFNAYGSYDTDGYIWKLRWDFGDGTFATGRTPTHSYNLEGLLNKTYVVTLTVYDDDSAYTSTSVEVTVTEKIVKE